MLGGEQSNYAEQLPRAELIGRLNDRLRKHGLGGRIIVTNGVSSLPQYDPVQLIRALAAYDSFDADNDPHGERDFGDLELGGEGLLWKIDYYDRNLAFGSEDPADPDVTTRVLTVMLESEY
jgi:hypothetical protein